jgi:hypothetical protein
MLAHAREKGPQVSVAPHVSWLRGGRGVDTQNLLNIVILIVVLYLAFRIGAVVLRVIMGLLAIGLAVYLVGRLLNAI